MPPEESSASINALLEIPSGDGDSISVNPGSPPSPLPPLSNYPTNNSVPPPQRDELVEKRDRSMSTAAAEEEMREKREAAEMDEKQSSPPPTPHPARFVLDPAGQFTHDETTVDVVTVPCPGGHPLKTWSRDALMGRYFGAPAMRDAEGPAATADSQATSSVNSDRPTPSWVRQGVRREADRARIVLYEHPVLGVDGAGDVTLSVLADALLDELVELREREEARGRPVVFVAHSIGGLVVKMALVKASRNSRFEDIWKQCYGVAFFGGFPD